MIGMVFTDSAMVVRTKRNTTVGCHMIATNHYISMKPDEFPVDLHNIIRGDSFTFTQNGYGDIIVTVLEETHEKKTPIEHKITILNVTNLEIRSYYVS